MSTLASVPSNFSNLTAPPSVISLTTYGPSQCIFNFPGCLKNLLSYIRTRLPTSKWLLLMCLSCHAFFLYFSTFWWKPAMKKYSSKCISWSNISSTSSTSVISVSTSTLKIGTIYSIGMTTSFPYTSWNGVWTVDFLHVVRYSHSTTDIFWSQSSLHTL